MSHTTTPRQPSFMMFDEQKDRDEERATTSGVASRLPASRLDLDSNENNRSLIDLTPSGEVQMRVTDDSTERRIPMLQTGASGVTTRSAENSNIQKLRQELEEHREAERRIMGLLESHSDDGGRQFSFRESCGGGDNYSNKGFESLLNDGRQVNLRGQSDQCFGPSTNTPWKAPHDMRAEGCGISVQVDRNGCVDTMTPPGRRNTNVGHEHNNIVNSHSTSSVNNSSVSNQVPFLTGVTNQIKPKKPPTFDGSGSWQDFLVQFEMISTVNKWDGNTKAYELATSLRGVAQGIVTDIEPSRRLDYNYLVSALTSRFEPANQENMYKVQMNSFHRKSNQTLPEMAQEIRRITRLAYPTAPIEIRDQLAKDCFVRAVNDPKIQLSIFQREPKKSMIVYAMG